MVPNRQSNTWQNKIINELRQNDSSVKSKQDMEMFSACFTERRSTVAIICINSAFLKIFAFMIWPTDLNVFLKLTGKHSSGYSLMIALLTYLLTRRALPISFRDNGPEQTDFVKMVEER
ncbi:hypothetical protein MPH_10782 [Macrophomina phaseolina MS6]|uniref:Uncharacterized protein n=1 Tax=Macrophomina phaseolina (strain MS6) TaxID=1126212 RepID=K2QQB2_MACPH|nr:hypothetical protein MPH_10782 [Macrophomina phaseolina MS6]